MKTLKGRCLCGAVKYTVPDDFQYAGFCHCSDCSRFSGSACSAIGGISADRFQVIGGRDGIATFERSESTVLAFCRVCGSSLYAAKPKQGMIHLRLGTLDESPGLAPQCHSHVGSKAEWDRICDGLREFDAGRPSLAPKPHIPTDRR